ncbi:hypothetical protein cce_5042 [Crocosphaera subtropica ATCC 51142]|uniref:CHASE2 domain-containing protein n=1 Tax=Crocosphaera subtropica (strain ATCC 51142 / BH68) TaxID=43989 RepID=B1X2M7_CROS5|nr:CHASE2 domain-containing protein [Crocosphaera subtropica]ACB54388.1 hypothetical protein cce_5042 [Crocosphaera subtropica ATCC 51142]
MNKRFRQSLKISILPLVVCLIRLMGGWQSAELSTMDIFFQLKRRDAPDPRIVIVGWQESDIYHFKRIRPSDKMLAQVVEKLQKAEPAVVGIDFLRDIPEPPGREEFLAIFQKYDQVFASAKVTGSQEDPNFAPLPPPPIQESKIADVSAILDGDGVKRRSFLYAQTDPPIPNLGWAVAREYLADKGILPDNNSKWLRLNGITFDPVHQWHSPYVRVDDRGYQIVPNWRKSQFQEYSFAEVLRQDFKLSQVRRKIVLIGATAPSLKDRVFLPFNSNIEGSPTSLPGVASHAQTASFILSATLNGRPIIKFVQEPWISLVIILWGLIGASMLRFPLIARTLLVSGVSFLLIFSSYGLFLKGWWLPIVPCLVAFLSNCLILSVVQYEKNQKEQLEKISQINAKLETRVEKAKIYQEFAAFCSHIARNLLDDYQFLINFKSLYQKLIKAVLLEMETLIEEQSVYRKLENSLSLVQQVTINEADEKIKMFGAFLSRSLPGMDIDSFDLEGLNVTKSQRTLDQLIPEIVVGNLRQIFYDLYDWDSKTQCYFQLDNWSISLDSKLLLKFLHKMIDEVLDIADNSEASEKVKIFFQSSEKDANKMFEIQITYSYTPQEITALEWTINNYQIKVKTLEEVTIWTIII